jgi:glutamyl-tRNA synthetase
MNDLTRIAPTPSGFLHLGNVLSFCLTAALARKNGARILLRIDDLDRARYDARYVQDIFDTLEYLSIPWDEGPHDLLEFEKKYSQVHRMDLYEGTWKRLRESGRLFACVCSRSQLSQEGAERAYPGTCRGLGISLEKGQTAWRVGTGDDPGRVRVRKVNGEVEEFGFPSSMRDFVVRKKDGFPAYQVSSLVDDLYFGVDLIVRGEDLFPSSLAQTWLAGQLGEDRWSGVRFFHHPLLRSGLGQKLSKSAGDTSIQYLRGQGMKPAGIFSMIGEMLTPAASQMDRPVADWAALADYFFTGTSSSTLTSSPTEPPGVPK